MIKFDFTKDEYEVLVQKAMLNEELAEIFKMRNEGYSNTQISMKLNMSESTVKRRVKKIANKINKAM